MEKSGCGGAGRQLLWLIIVSVLEWYQLDLSCNLTEQIHIINAKSIVLNICLIMVVNVLFNLLVNRLWLTMAVSEAVWTAVALINYYVIQYHGMPFTISELQNLNTALNVLKSYHLEIGVIPIKIIIIFGSVIVYSFYKRKKETICKRSIQTIALPGISVL